MIAGQGYMKIVVNSKDNFSKNKISAKIADIARDNTVLKTIKKFALPKICELSI